MLTEREMFEVKEEARILADKATSINWKCAGGTESSSILMGILAHRKCIQVHEQKLARSVVHDTDPSEEQVRQLVHLAKVDALLLGLQLLAQESLKRHNSQEQKYFTYDIQTGMIVD